MLRSAVLSTLACVAFAAAQAAGPEALPIIRKAPQLTFKLPGGGQKTLAQYAGKVIALEFIETTCPHCQAASHVMTKLQQELGARGFQAIDLAINTTADTDISSFKLTQQTDFLVGFIDPYQMMAFMGISPGTRFVVPQLVLIDRTGNIRLSTPPTYEEEVTKEDNLRPKVITLLAKKNLP